MKKLFILLCVLGLVGLAHAQNLAINPNFELDANGDESLVERGFGDCLGWGGWGPDTLVVADSAWGDAHPTAQMAARIGPNVDNSIWQNTGIVAEADRIYVLSADIKSEYAWNLVLRFESIDNGSWGNQINNWFTPQNHADWRTYSATLDTAEHPEYVGLVIGIGVVNKDWDWGRTYATNVRLEVQWGPSAPEVEQVVDNANNDVDVILHWNAAEDLDGVYEVDPDLVRQDVYLSTNRNVSTDPNLYYIGSDTSISLDDPCSQYPESGNLNLDFDGAYDWAIVSILTGGDQTVPPQNALLNDATDPNNHVGPIWSFETLASVPVIAEQPANVLDDPGASVEFAATVDSISQEHYQWFYSIDNVTDEENDTPMGTDSNTLALTLPTDPAEYVDVEGYYYCRVTNEATSPGGGNQPPVYTTPASLAVKRQVAYWSLDQADYAADQYLDLSLEDAIADNADPCNPAGVAFATGPYSLGGSSAVPMTNDSRATVANMDPSQYSDQLTISAWIRVTGDLTDEDGYGIAGKGSGTANNADNWKWTFYVRDRGEDQPSVRLLSWAGGDAWSAPGSIPVNEWVHVAATVEFGNVATVYVNGLPSGYGDSTFTYGDDDAGPIRIGDYGAAGYTFPGVIDEIKVYNYGMDNLGIADLYNDVSGERVCILDYASQFDVANGETGLSFDDEGFTPDCKVDLYDFAEYTANWLSCGLYPNCP